MLQNLPDTGSGSDDSETNDEHSDSSVQPANRTTTTTTTTTMIMSPAKLTQKHKQNTRHCSSYQSNHRYRWTDAVFFLGISPEGIAPGNVEFPRQNSFTLVNKGRRRGRIPGNSLLPQGARSLEYILDRQQQEMGQSCNADGSRCSLSDTERVHGQTSRRFQTAHRQRYAVPHQALHCRVLSNKALSSRVGTCLLYVRGVMNAKNFPVDLCCGLTSTAVKPSAAQCQEIASGK